MKILPRQTVRVKWYYKTREHYESLGYVFTKYYEEFEVPLEHLTKGSHVKVKYICDYCGSNIEMAYKDYLNNKKSATIDNDCCKSCWHLKLKEAMNGKYGVDNTSQLESTKLKKQHTSMKNYGVDNPSKNPKIAKKQINTLKERYGVSNIMHVESVKRDVFKKRAISLYKNGTAPCSSQQKYIHRITGGELNYPVKVINLDIALVDEKIYIEVDASGHNLQVAMGNLTAKEKEMEDYRRRYKLKSLGWKEIRIVSNKDMFPATDVVVNMVRQAKEHFKTGGSWMSFDIDRGKVSSGVGEYDYDYGALTKINPQNYLTA